MAPQVGFEPTTDRLTADCSTTELLWNNVIKSFIFVITNILLTPASARLFEDVNASGLLVADSVDVLLVARRVACPFGDVSCLADRLHIDVISMRFMSSTTELLWNNLSITLCM